MYGKIRVAKDEQILTVEIPVNFLREGENIIADCPALGLCTYQRTLEKARLAFDEAFRLWMETVSSRCSLHAALCELGWVFTSKTVTPREADYSEVPLHLLKQSYKPINIPRSFMH